MRTLLFLLMPVIAVAGASCQKGAVPRIAEPPRAISAGDGQTVKSVSFSPDGSILAIGGQNKKIQLIRVSDGSELWASVPQPDAVLAVTYSADGKYLAATCGDNTENTSQIVVYDGSSKSELWSVRKMTNDVQCAEFSPDNRVVAIANYFSVILYESATGKQLHFLSGHSIDVSSPSGHVGAVSDMVFTRDSRNLITVGWDRSVKVWDLTAGRETKSYPEADPINACLLTPGEDRVITASVESIHVWNLTTNRTDTVLSYDGEIQSLAWIKSGAYFVSGDQTGDVVVWRYSDWSQVSRFKNMHPEGVWGLTASADGETVASSGGGGRVMIWTADYLVQGRSNADSLRRQE